MISRPAGSPPGCARTRVTLVDGGRRRRAVRRLQRLLHDVALRPRQVRGDPDARRHTLGSSCSRRPVCPPATSLLGYDERRALPDADRRRVLDLRGAAADVPHLRLPGLRGGRDRGGPRGDHAAGAALGFGHPTQGDRDEHAAVQAPRRSCGSAPSASPAAPGRASPVQVAFSRIKVYDVFLERATSLGRRARVVGRRRRQGDDGRRREVRGGAAAAGPRHGTSRSRWRQG